MSDGAALAIAGGVVVGGVIIGVVVWRNRKAAQSPDASVCASVVQPLGRLVGFDVPPQACGAIDGALAKVAAFVNKWAQYDADNKRLNGAVKVPLAVELQRASGTNGGIVGQAGEVSAIKGTVVEFVNGCRPFAGAPGFDKCAPGTHDMLAHHGAGVKAPFFRGEQRADVRRDYMFTGKAGDPFTGIGLAPGGLAAKPYAEYVAGARVVPCPGQTVETATRATIASDHRTGLAVLWCNAPQGASGGYREASGAPSVGTIITTTGPRITSTTIVRDHD